MKRLTYRNTDGSVGINAYRYYNYEDFQELTNKLAEYEDAEEQGLLHKAPLKNGTLIWYFQYGFDEGPYLTSGTYLYGVTEYEIGEFKKDFWLSEEEAEQALTEMKGGQNG